MQTIENGAEILASIAGALGVTMMAEEKLDEEAQKI